MIKNALSGVLKGLGYTINKIPVVNNRMAEDVFARSKDLVARISPEREVLNGPFTGLRYPSLEITEAALAPKIVGSYEYQLQPFFERVIKGNYTDIIDIGSAEGYYAVGLGKVVPDATVHCFDINQKDIEFCKKMAAYNQVSNITYNNFCDSQTLINFKFAGKGFILCDCEGYELELFTDDVVKSLKNVDLLIEMHDIANPRISSTILSRFQHTHNFEVINNYDINRSDLKGLGALSDDEKFFATLEHRGGYYKNIFMEWAFLTSKVNEQ